LGPEEIAAIKRQRVDERNNRHDPPMEFVKNLDREPCSAEKTGGR
jgi:hypothetical protein